jgi:hypothetical protein
MAAPSWRQMALSDRSFSALQGMMQADDVSIRVQAAHPGNTAHLMPGKSWLKSATRRWL